MFNVEFYVVLRRDRLGGRLCNGSRFVRRDGMGSAGFSGMNKINVVLCRFVGDFIGVLD